MDRLRVMLVDDHALFREGLRLVLEAQGEFDVVGEAGNATDALREARSIQPDVVVMDISMEGNGLKATRQILEAIPGTRVLILTMHGSEEYFFRALHAGAMGYLVKGTTSDELITALRAVGRDEVYIQPSMARYLVNDYLSHSRSEEEQEVLDKITEREREVLGLIAQGYTNPEIAERLYISVHTVQTHRGHIMEKLNLHSRGELLKCAVRLGFLGPT